MTYRNVTRRGFVAGCSAAVASLAGSRFNNLAFAAEPVANGNSVLVIFLRGGMDGLSLMPPTDGSDRGIYEALRPTLQIPTQGAGSALDLGNGFGLHPSAEPLLDVFRAGQMAIVQSAGLTEVNRSHFDAMLEMELGAAFSESGRQGWLTRYLRSNEVDAEMRSVAAGDLQPTSLLGHYETVNFAYPYVFNVGSGLSEHRDDLEAALGQLYRSGRSFVHQSGFQSWRAMKLVNESIRSDYSPTGGVVYPDTSFGEQLSIVAQIIRKDLGLQVATIDLGGWDTHEGQGSGSTGYFSDLVGELAGGLGALVRDLEGAGKLGQTTIVVQSEFGRELRENSDSGTEHGHGNSMLVLGGGVRGGFHGDYLGLAEEALTEGTDLAVTTDYRDVLWEVISGRLGGGDLAQVFPRHQYRPVGILT